MYPAANAVFVGLKLFGCATMPPSCSMVPLRFTPSIGVRLASVQDVGNLHVETGVSVPATPFGFGATASYSWNVPLSETPAVIETRVAEPRPTALARASRKSCMIEPASLYVSRSYDAKDRLGRASAARMPMSTTTTMS